MDRLSGYYFNTSCRIGIVNHFNHLTSNKPISNEESGWESHVFNMLTLYSIQKKGENHFCVGIDRQSIPLLEK